MGLTGHIASVNDKRAMARRAFGALAQWAAALKAGSSRCESASVAPCAPWERPLPRTGPKKAFGCRNNPKPKTARLWADTVPYVLSPQRQGLQGRRAPLARPLQTAQGQRADACRGLERQKYIKKSAYWQMNCAKWFYWRLEWFALSAVRIKAAWIRRVARLPQQRLRVFSGHGPRDGHRDRPRLFRRALLCRLTEQHGACM